VDIRCLFKLDCCFILSADPIGSGDACEANHKLSSNEKIQLIEAFAQKIGRPVDLIDLFDPPQPLLGQIIKTGRRILGTDDAFANLAYRNMMDQADFMPLRTRALLERREAWTSKS